MDASDLPMYCMLWRLLSWIINLLLLMAWAFERPCLLSSTTWTVMICCASLLACCMVIVALHTYATWPGVSIWSTGSSLHLYSHTWWHWLIKGKQPSSSTNDLVTLFCVRVFVRQVCFLISYLVMITRIILSYVVGAVYFVAVTCSYDFKSSLEHP
jgi:hypothetical protein